MDIFEIIAAGLFLIFAILAIARFVKNVYIGLSLYASERGSFPVTGTATVSTPVEVVKTPSRLVGGHNGRGQRRSSLDKRRKMTRMRKTGI